MDDDLLSLDFLTVRDATAAEVVSAAAAHGIHKVSLLFQPVEFIGDYGLIGDTPARREALARCRAEGVIVDQVEAVFLTPQTVLEDYRPAFESAALFEPNFVACVIRDGDDARAQDNLGRYIALAKEFGLRPLVEFMPVSATPSIASAVKAVTKAGGDLALEFDVLNMSRCGDTPAAMRTVDPRLIGRAQLCDGPLTVDPDKRRHEALWQRRIPGEGALPLVDFVRALPEGTTIGLEVPLEDLMQQGVSVVDRVGRVLAGARKVLSAAGV